ncbi:MAG: hypothetical protein R3E08_12305 [Thiotrichaceae bacterium]
MPLYLGFLIILDVIPWYDPVWFKTDLPSKLAIVIGVVSIYKFMTVEDDKALGWLGYGFLMGLFLPIYIILVNTLIWLAHLFSLGVTQFK